MAEVRLTAHAVADLRELDAFLRERNEAAANRVSLLLDAGLRKLSGLPRLGPPLRDHSGYRQLFVGFGASGYVIRYRLLNEGLVLVVRVRHTLERR